MGTWTLLYGFARLVVRSCSMYFVLYVGTYVPCLSRGNYVCRNCSNLSRATVQTVLSSLLMKVDVLGECFYGNPIWIKEAKLYFQRPKLYFLFESISSRYADVVMRSFFTWKHYFESFGVGLREQSKIILYVKFALSDEGEFQPWCQMEASSLR
jgi:hypothetical protein